MSTEIIKAFYEHVGERTVLEAMKEEVSTPVVHSSHCSDLYVKRTPEVTEWLNKHKLIGTVNCNAFHSNDGTGIWYDLTFMYSEYHSNRG